ncbi:MAG: dioxygenase [Burkholderiales bacterium]|nr:dioxygenase [Burkholderiales bacterium]
MDLMPTLFVSHGAPTFALEPGELGPRLTQLGRGLPRPAAVLVVSPHWMSDDGRVTSAPAPATVHDFGGFAPALYGLSYPSPGAPALAVDVATLLTKAGWPTGLDARRGYDHGAWVPLRHLYPEAGVPVIQLAMPAVLDADAAYEFGTALAPLRERGVLIVGSGSLTHNLYEFRHRATDGEAAYAREFADWARATVTSRDHVRLRRTMDLAPHARRAHPTTEHLLPLLIAAGAAGVAAPVTVLEGGITHGVLAMDSYVFGML